MTSLRLEQTWSKRHSDLSGGRWSTDGFVQDDQLYTIVGRCYRLRDKSGFPAFRTPSCRISRFASLAWTSQLNAREMGIGSQETRVAAKRQRSRTCDLSTAPRCPLLSPTIRSFDYKPGKLICGHEISAGVLAWLSDWFDYRWTKIRGERDWGLVKIAIVL